MNKNLNGIYLNLIQTNKSFCVFRQRLEMKLKRLKEEYINVRKELYTRIEENNTLQHDLVECRFKNDYNLHITNQTFNSLKSV
jgi:hypothetical protein